MSNQPESDARLEETMKVSADLSALAILIHTAIEEINPAAAGEEYYDCEALGCASGLGIAITAGWLDSDMHSDVNGSVSRLFKVKLTDAGRAKVDDLMLMAYHPEQIDPC
jgi:hypothetical protein